MAASVNRYVFTYHTKVKWATVTTGTFSVFYMLNDNAAIQLAEWLEANWLPNNMKVTVSRTLRQAADPELPDNAHLTDEALVKYLFKAEHSGRVQCTLPAKYPYEANQHSSLLNLLRNGLYDAAGNAVTGVISENTSGKNIVQGGMVPPSRSEDPDD